MKESTSDQFNKLLSELTQSVLIKHNSNYDEFNNLLYTFEDNQEVQEIKQYIKTTL